MGNTALDLDLVSQEATSRRLAKKKLNRRTVIKAAAAFSAMSAEHSTRRPRARAQGVTTLAAEWVQPDGLGGTGDSLGFQADFPFHAIAPHWPGDTEYSAAVELQVSGDGQTWSEPVVIGPAHTDAGPADRDNRIFGQLAFTEESRYVRYRPLDANGNMQSLPGLLFTYIDATGGPGLGDISTESPVPSLDRPPIISREEWGANLAYGGVEGGAKEWIPEFQTVEHIIIHHSKTANFRDPLAEIRSIHYYHAVTRGWGDIGYNYLVDFMGNVYEGRVGGDNVVGGHAYQYAYGSAGICTIGSFSMAATTPEALAGLIWITAWSSRYLDPLGRADFHEKPNLPTICGHRDVNDSSCPGDGLYADLNFIREAVAEVLAGTRETIPDPAYSPGQVVETVSGGVNLRQRPGTGEPIVRELPYGSVFQVIDGPTTVDNHVWYQLEGEAGFGWVAASTFGPSNAASPAGKFKIGEELVMNTDGINIRETPSLKGLISATLPYMAKAVVVSGPMPANGYKWYQVTTDYGAGWSAERYLAREGEVTPPTRFVVGDAVQVGDPEGIRLRTGPSSQSTPIASLSPGVRGVVIEGPTAADGFVWLKIQTSQGSGWCAEEFLDEAPSADPPAARFGPGDRVLVDTDSLNLRESPGATAPIVVPLGTGVSANVVGGPETANNMNWYQLETDYGSGWSVEQFLTKEEATSTSRVFSPGNRVYVNTDSLNLRSSPGMNSEVVAVLVTNDGGEIADGPVEKDGFNWYHVRSDAGTGWGAAQYLGKGIADPFSEKTFSVGDTVYVDTDLLNIRAEASLSGTIVATLEIDESATVSDGTAEANGFSWVNVASAKGAGWCVVDYLAKVSGNGPRTGDTARVFDGELNLRAVTSLGSDVIAVIPDATYVEVLEGPVGAESYDWYRVSTSRFGTGWCAGQWLAVV